MIILTDKLMTSLQVMESGAVADMRGRSGSPASRSDPVDRFERGGRLIRRAGGEPARGRHAAIGISDGAGPRATRARDSGATIQSCGIFFASPASFGSLPSRRWEGKRRIAANRDRQGNHSRALAGDQPRTAPAERALGPRPAGVTGFGPPPRRKSMNHQDFLVSDSYSDSSSLR